MSVPLIDEKTHSSDTEDGVPEMQDAGGGECWTWDIVFVFQLGDERTSVYLEEERTSIEVPYFNPATGKTETKDEVVKKLVPHLIRPITSVFKVREEKHSVYCHREIFRYVQALNEAGLKTKSYLSIDKKEVYVLIGATEARLQEEAERTEYPLALDSQGCIEAGLKFKLLLAQHAKTKEDQEQNNLFGEDKWRSLYGRFVKEKSLDHENLYKKYGSDYVVMGEKITRPLTFFSTIDRLKLIKSIIEAEPREGGAGLETAAQSKNSGHPLVAEYPLHVRTKLHALKKEWVRPHSMLSQPIFGIREYFGEHVAFYFAFLQTYNRWLLLPAFVGIIAFIVQETTKGEKGGANNPFNLVYGIFMAVWSTVLCEFWKRHQAAYRTDWGMSNFLANERPRPEFHGIWSPDPVDGRPREIFPYETQAKRKYLSQSFIWMMIAIVLGAVVSLFIFRAILLTSIGQTWGGILAGVINTIQIQIMNYGYGRAAVYLNDWENHRTQTEYDNALIYKSFLFKFVNNYNSLVYIAFFKRFDIGEGCEDGKNCMGELQIQLATIFITQLVLNNIIELSVPKLQAYRREQEDKELFSRRTVALPPRTAPEKEYLLEPYESTLADFDEIVIQYGYVTLFVVAFPLCPLFALFNNVVEQYLDTTKLCDLSRRPHPRGAESIGTWYWIIETVGVLAVISNLAIVMFTTTLGDRMSDDNANVKFMIFIVVEHVLLVIKFAVASLIPDEPEAIQEHLLRQKHVVASIIDAPSYKKQLEEALEEKKEDAKSSAAKEQAKADAYFAELRLPEGDREINNRMASPIIATLEPGVFTRFTASWLDRCFEKTPAKPTDE